MNWLKGYLQDFPTQNGTVAVALLLILFTGLTVVVRLAIGQPFPQNYDTWIWALVALTGVNVAGMVGKRLSDIEYKKAGVAAPSPVNVQAPSTVTVSSPVVPMADMPPVLTKADADAAAAALEANQQNLQDKDK